MELLSCVEIDPSEAAVASVIWLHGLGADGHDFAPIVPELKLPSSLPIRFIFPHAPVRPVTVNDGMTMRAWYDILEMDVERKIDVAAVYQSSAQVEALIRREQERGIESQRILLAGFSQGGVVAYHTALRYPEPLAGVMALSTYLVTVASLKEELSPANRNIPLFVAHGTLDPVVPLALGRQAFDTLVDMGYQPNWHEYPMPHTVCPEEIEAIAAWLKQVLTVSG